MCLCALANDVSKVSFIVGQPLGVQRERAGFTANVFNVRFGFDKYIQIQCVRQNDGATMMFMVEVGRKAKGGAGRLWKVNMWGIILVRLKSSRKR